MKKLIATAMLVLPVMAHADEALLKKYGCVVCHQAQVKAVGPAWKDIATKYQDRKDTVAYLSKKIRSGGSGVWGPIPMPPHPQVPESAARDMATYVLTVK